MRERVVARVPSLSDPRARYDVVERRDGTLTCECPAFASWRKRGKPCWHLRVLATTRAAVARCRDAAERGAPGHLTVGGLCDDCALGLVAALAARVKANYVEKPPPKRRRKKQPDVGLDVEP